MQKPIITIAFLWLSSLCWGQEINVLFLGNSYTAVNDLPGTISGLLEGTGKVMHYESNTPGGYTFFQHLDNQTSMNLIRQGHWDFVVLQEQSQMPSIDYYRYNSMYPAATKLRDSIKKYNACTNVVFYMTWGRQYGGQQCEDYGEGTYCSADFVDFNHMQDTMTRAYCEITERLQEITAPVGEAWRRTLQQTDIGLFASDGSHPNAFGTYLTACVFYSTFWHEQSIGLPCPQGIEPMQAETMQRIASRMVLSTITPWDFTDKTEVDFIPSSEDQQHFFFKNLSTSPFLASYHWDFGDGTTSDEYHAYHEYSESGDYDVTLTLHACRITDSITITVTAVIEPISTGETDNNISISPNPCKDKLFLSGCNESSFTIFDPKGHTVLQGETKTNVIDCSSLSEGLFLIRIHTNGREKVFRFIHKNAY